MKVSQKKDIHLLFNLDDERQRKAFEIFLAQSTPRKRTDFIADAILAYHNNCEIAKLIAAEILGNCSGIKARSPKTTSATSTGKTGRPRGRPPKPKPEPAPAQPTSTMDLSSAPQATGIPTQPPAADGDNHELLDAIMESFG